MSDTQWPLYHVFHQERPGKPYEHVGAVHAPDAEMALQNARDVFVRRPRCVGAWVVPDTAVLQRTRQQLERNPAELEETADSQLPRQEFYVCAKSSQRRAMTFVTLAGTVEARTPKEALRLAVDQFTDEEVFVWWVFPVTAVAESSEEDVESWYGPALDKPYRHPSAYKTFTALRRAKQEE